MKLSPNTIIKQLFTIIGISLLSTTASAQCQAPGSVAISNIEPTSITATWTASPSSPAGLEYNWEIRSANAAGSGVDGLAFSGSTVNDLLTVTVNNLVFETDYIFYVRYKCAELDNSAWTASAPFQTDVLQTPVTTPATNVLDVSFRANWNPVAGASGYFLDVATTSAFTTGTFVSGYENLYTTNSFANVTGLTANTEYFYRVRAEGTGGNGYYLTPNSNTTSRTTLGPQTDWVIWNGTEWTPTENAAGPDETLDAFIDGPYDTATFGAFRAKSLTINEGKSLTINSFTDISVVNSVTNNNPTNTGFVIETNGYLVQDHSGSNPNIGKAQVQRASAPLYRLDYTMWSSPTASTTPVAGGQTLQEFSPLTSENRFYTYNTTTDLFSPIARTNQFIAGEGYLIRVRNNHPAFVSSGTPGTTWTGTFKGVPFSGDLAVGLDTSGDRFNMIGNPYPSLVKSDDFLALNTNIEGTLYFWRRRNNDITGDEATSAYYATYTTAGGVSTGTPSDGSSLTPTAYIQVGQGFLVQAKPAVTAQQVQFNNVMRSADLPATPFFRTATVVNKDRIWLNVADATKFYNQTLVAYMDGASNDLDRADGKYLNDGTVALTSYVDNKEYVIQGRAPFNVADVVALNFKTPVAGSYTISIDHVDGLFLGDQAIYLKDNVTQTQQNLKDAAYTFATEAGNFNNRFELVYANALSANDAVLDPNGVIVFKQNGNININAGTTTIASVKVFDIRGSLIAEKSNVNASETTLNAGSTKQVLIVQITSTDNQIVSKKIIN